MRNCFVPGCDNFCKINCCIQRKMFFAPKEMFEKWKEKLPNKREFKANDRVCERHFEADQIIEYWENTINGQIHRTKREKPKLKSDALPTLNLPTWKEFTSKPLQLNKQFVKKRPEILFVESLPQKKPKTETPSEVNPVVSSSPEKSIPNPVDDDSLELFENLYDEVHDVTLPSTLFGINRCPDRQFIVFNKFNVESMSFDKYLFITNTLDCKVCIDGQIVERKILCKENCNTDYVGEWLDKIDEQ